MRSHSPHRIRCTLAGDTALQRRVAAWVALCLVTLQLVTALHFALVPHRFGAGLDGFVHVHAAFGPSQTEASGASARAPSRHEAVLAGGATPCAPDSCPIGFAGPSSILVAPSDCRLALPFSVVTLGVPPLGYAAERSRVLLSAPKTSPPAQV